MKKLVSLSLAALMVLSLSAVAFAATGVVNPGDVFSLKTGTPATSASGVKAMGLTMWVSENDINPDNDDILIVNSTAEYHDDKTTYTMIQPGWTAYYPLLKVGALGTDLSKAGDNGDGVSVSDAVKSMKISTKYLMGQSYIESIKVVYKKARAGGVEGYSYFIAIKTKAYEGTGYQDFSAEIGLKKSSGGDGTGSPASTTNYTFDLLYNVSFRMRRDAVALIFKNAFRINTTANGLNTADPDAEETYEFPETNGVYFEAKMFAQGTIIVAMNLGFDKEVIALYPDANIDFYNGTGTFNKIGELVIPAEPGSFIYGRNADGKLVAIEAEYDDGEEAFRVATRVLGRYVVSDVELDLSRINAVIDEPILDAPVIDAPIDVKPIPPTGGIA